MTELSSREWEVLELLADDLSYKAIGQKLDTSPATIRQHAHRIYLKLGAKGRLTAALNAGLLVRTKAKHVISQLERSGDARFGSPAVRRRARGETRKALERFSILR